MNRALAAVAVVAAALAACRHPMGQPCGPSDPLRGCPPDYRCAAYEQGADAGDIFMCVPCTGAARPGALPDVAVDPGLDALALTCADRLRSLVDDEQLAAVVLIESSELALERSDLREVEGHLVIADNGVLQEVAFENLERVGGEIIIVRNPRLVDVRMPALAHERPIVMHGNGAACTDVVGDTVCGGDAGCVCGSAATFQDAGF